MEATYRLKDFKTEVSAAASQNACKLCAPLGASLVFKGIADAVPLLHGSQGCSTYIRRYLISHFKEPIDIACSNFGEQTAIFGGGANIKLALDNIISQYSPELIGVATTCLAETIGDDVPMFVHEYRKLHSKVLLPPIVHVSTPSYRGTHMQGFYDAVLAIVKTLAIDGSKRKAGSRSNRINLFPGMVSPADLRHLKQIVEDFGLEAMVLPDYSETLDGELWTGYQRIPPGGTRVADIANAGSALASIELGHVPATLPETGATCLEERFGVPAYRLGRAMGIHRTDDLMKTLETISGKPIPLKYARERGRLIDALVDGHKTVNKVRAIVYGEADLVTGMAEVLSEIGVLPVVCATGEKGVRLSQMLEKILTPAMFEKTRVMEGADFADIEEVAGRTDAEIMIGHSKGYSLSRKLNIPLVRIGFPVHDRVGGSRVQHLGYQGAQSLFDRISDAVMEKKQSGSDVGYTYM